MTPKERVLKIYPDTYVAKEKGRVEIRRPRTENDPGALVRYVLMSGWQLTDLMAWDEADRRLGLTDPRAGLSRGICTGI